MKQKINIEKYIKKEINKALETTKLFLIKLDLDLSKKRDKTKYLSHSKKERTIITENGWINFKRRIYKFKNNYVSLLDQKINLKPFERILPEFKQKIISQMSKGKRQQDILDMFPKANISRSTISNIFKNSNIKKIKPLYKPTILNNQPIYINIDDGFLTNKKRNKKNKSRARVFSFHLGFDYQRSSKNRKILKNKRINFKLVNEGEKINSFEFAKKIYQTGMKYYNNFEKGNLILCGDGDKWIKDIASTLGAKYILDKFHAHKYIKDLFIRGKNKYESKNHKLKEKSILLFNNGEYLKLLEFLKKLKAPPNIYKYFKNNKFGILNQKEPFNIGSCTESDIFRLVKSNLGNGNRCYNQQTFKNILISKMNYINSQI